MQEGRGGGGTDNGSHNSLSLAQIARFYKTADSARGYKCSGLAIQVIKGKLFWRRGRTKMKTLDRENNYSASRH